MKLAKHLKIGLGAAGAFVFGLLFGWVIFPAMLKALLRKEMALSPKTDLRGMWTKLPFALDFKIYFFNYTNVEDIQKGALPIVKEIGPYYFEEYKEKVDMSDNVADDTITYRRLDSFYFKKELSAPGLTGEEVVTIPHIFIIALTTTTVRTKPAMLATAEKATNSIFDNPKDVFLRVKVLDLLFRGLLINCTKTDFAAKAVCSILKGEAIPGMTVEPDGQIRVSLFGGRNATPESTTFTVLRGMKNIMDVGKVVAANGSPKIGVWHDTCDEFGPGTDGTVFPPFIKGKDSYYSYSPDLCRTFELKFQKKQSYSGIRTNRYITTIGDLGSDPALQCFCDAADECPLKGLMDITKCAKAPLYASLPHFLDSDPSLVKNVIGLNPALEDHGIMADFEPITGSALQARLRVQMNILLIKVEKAKLFKELPDTVAPIFWIEEGFAMNKTWTKMIKTMLFLPKRIVAVTSWLLVVGGILGMVMVGLFHFKVIQFPMPMGSAKVTQADPQHEVSKISIVSTSPHASKPAD